MTKPAFKLALILVWLSVLFVAPRPAEALPPDCQWSAYGCDYFFYEDPGNPGNGTVHIICGGEYGGSYYGSWPGQCS